MANKRYSRGEIKRQKEEQEKKYNQMKSEAEQEIYEQSEREIAPMMLDNIEKEIQQKYGFEPPFDKKELFNNIPYFEFEQWDRYNSILNPDDDKINNNTGQNNAFGIDFMKPVDKNKQTCCENTLVPDLQEEHDIEEEQNMISDMPASAKKRELPKGWLNVCDANDGYSFDEMDDDEESIDYTGYDYGDT